MVYIVGIFVVTLVLVFVGCFWMGRRTVVYAKGKGGQYPSLLKVVILGYIVFAGCFGFPIGSEPYPVDAMNVYTLLVGYSMIGLGFAAVYGKNKQKLVYWRGLLLTVVGLVLRYVMEYGEVSNTYNFTVLNVVTFSVIMPTVIVIAYRVSLRYLVNKWVN